MSKFEVFISVISAVILQSTRQGCLVPSIAENGQPDFKAVYTNFICKRYVKFSHESFAHLMYFSENMIICTVLWL